MTMKIKMWGLHSECNIKLLLMVSMHKSFNMTPRICMSCLYNSVSIWEMLVQWWINTMLSHYILGCNISDKYQTLFYKLSILHGLITSQWYIVHIKFASPLIWETTFSITQYGKYFWNITKGNVAYSTTINILYLAWH